MSPLAALFNSAVRRYRHWAGVFPLRNASLSEGMRAACSASTMLLLGELLHQPLFSWAAIGSFLTCLADSAGSNRARLASMGGFSLASTIGGAATAWAAGFGIWPGALAIMLCAAIAGFSRIYGAATGLVLMLAAGVCAIMADSPVALWPPAQSHVLIYFLGCAWATLLGLTVWRIHPFVASRNAIARVYKSLAELAQITVGTAARTPVDSDDTAHLTALSRKHVRDDISAARKALSALPAQRTDHRPLYENLLIRLARAEAIHAYLTAVTDLRQSSFQPRAARLRSDRVLAAMSKILKAMQRDVADAPDVDGDASRMGWRIGRVAARLHPQREDLLPPLPGPISVMPALPGAASPDGACRRAADAAGKILRIAELHLSARSNEFFHGLRCAAAAGLTYLVVHALHMPFGYWATMATMLVMQPSISESWSRSMDRAGGSIVGGLLAVALCFFIHSQWLFTLMVFPMVLATMALRPVSYGLYATFLTPAFVLVADVSLAGGGSAIGNALMRTADNVIGAAVALLATYFFWPRHESADLHRKLSDTIIANLSYLRDALAESTADAKAMHDRRRDACVVNMETSLLLQRMRRESSLGDAQIQAATTALALSRKLAGDATHIWLDPHGAGKSAVFAAWLDDMIEAFDSRIAVQAVHQIVAQCPRIAMTEAQADAAEKIKLLAAALCPDIEPDD